MLLVTIISALAWILVGFILGNFMAMNRLIHSEELNQKLEDLRKIRYEADKSKTISHLLKMITRVNANLLTELFEEMNNGINRAKSVQTVAEDIMKEVVKSADKN